ncbi:polycystic kidney disease protein 1-like 1 [Antechinus flavipes]|uniref:polycystic kidney disease protein 1-like 1 n=1 Tax=Antechinus flavipes TaxID=38775 RepID=UPI002236944E|nr:polycystic kidney disease protein 1-like 1 [Antechinus flavipes]
MKKKEEEEGGEGNDDIEGKEKGGGKDEEQYTQLLLELASWIHWQNGSRRGGNTSVIVPEGGRQIILRSINITFNVPEICDLSVSVFNPHNHILFIQCLAGHIRIGGSHIDAFPLKMNQTSLWLPENNKHSSQDLGFGVHTSSDNITSLVFDFGDGTVVQVSIQDRSDEIEIITYHQYRKEGTYRIKVIIFNEFHRNEKELGPYYVKISQEDLRVFMNSSSVHKDEVLLFVNSLQRTTTRKSIVIHKFSSISSYNVFLMVPNKANGCQDWINVNIQYQMQAVSIFTNGTVFASDSEVTFFVHTNEMSPLEFVWHFGDGSWTRTTSRSVKKRYSVPKKYSVIVNAVNQISSVASNIHTISIERKIVPNRLVSSSSALINSSVSFECRINFGTNVTYIWNFGDDTIHPGKWIESHIYTREGEFTVEVLIFNSVSIATLKKQVFIVSKPCQPPLVKNMGPGKIQIWRHQPVKLGVTFEAPIQCDISQGLNYSWSLMKSDGSLVLLPTALNKHGQTILLPGYFLEYGNYTALAKVKIEGSVVYSNYSAVIEVVSQSPVSVISEGTHLLISKTLFSIVVLNGSQSFDPDYPGTHLKYYWKCVPASKPKHTCFNSPKFNNSASVISFPASLLYDPYDQFLVTLMVSNGNRNSSEAQVFLSVQSSSTFRPLHISWVNFKDNSVNWNEEFSLQVKCEECTKLPNISYSWDLFLINATETNGMEENISITELNENEDIDTMFDNDDGYNLIDSSYSTENTAPLLMVDWSKSLISRTVFQSYTSSGITSKTVTFKPFFLRGGETYVIQASVVSNHNPLGKAQLYFTVNEVPKEMSCQVQPSHGYEVYTVFSVFCMSGKADYYYEFSYQIGKSSKIPLYRGRDIQYYFTLPAGEIMDKYKVTVFMEITNRYGSKSHPCAVNVTVLPSFHRNGSSLNYRPEEDLYNSSLKNLTTLLLMGNYGEIRNYIIMLTKILNHFYAEDQSYVFDLQSQMRNLLISSVCSLSFQDQEEIADSILMLNELINISKQVTFNSVVLIIKYVRKLIDHKLSGQFVMKKELMSKVVFLASKLMEVKEKEKSRNAKHFKEELITSIVTLLLNYVSSSKEFQFNIRTEQLGFQTRLYYTFHNSVEHIGSVKVYLPDALHEDISDRMELHSQCYISQLIYFKEYPYLEERVPVQISGAVVALSLYNCITKKKIMIKRLKRPVRVVFENNYDLDGGQNKTIFSLYRDKMNFHYFSGLPEASQESLQIVVEFSKTNRRTFPIMLLVRFSEKPTVSTFNIKQIRSWDEQVVQIYIPAASLKDASFGYLSLLDANYDQKPTNKYLANPVNYTVSFHWIRCLFWDENRGWISEGSYPQQGTTPQIVNCSYNHFTTFTVVRRKLNSNFEVNDASLLKSISQNLFPSILVMFFMLLFAFLAIVSKHRDLHEQKKNGYIFLQENSQASDKQIYAVIIDTGFRAQAQLTAKVHIVFYGEYEFSETRELYCPDKPLFERNSRHTFIVSIPNNLGPLWKIHLWHDNSGCSPSWYISHVIVKDLITGASWFFPAECWLAVNKWAGKVDRELVPLRNGLGFKKLLYSKFTEYLEDFHMWISVYSRPSYSCFTHTERLIVCLFLVFGYMSINAALIVMEQEEQNTLEEFILEASPGNENEKKEGSGTSSPRYSRHLEPYNRLEEPALQKRMVLPLWLSHIAWITCGLVSVACGLVTGLLGYRFAPSKCVQWIHSVFFSIVGCIFVAQPLVIFFVALTLAWRKKDHKGFFIEALYDATKNLEYELHHFSKNCTLYPSYCCIPNTAADFEKILVARQRARYLQWVHPPTSAQLKEARGRIRKEVLLQTAIRNFFTYILMLFLLLFIIFGKISHHEYVLNQAIRNEFIRNARNSFIEVKNADDWWNWSLTTLLDGLYWDKHSINMPETQFGPLGGKCHLIGTSVIRQLKFTGQFTIPVEFSSLVHQPGNQDNKNVLQSDPEKLNVTQTKRCLHCDQVENEDGKLSVVNLGKTRDRAYSVLINLRNSGWIDKRTREISIHFALYNPPTNLFTSVSLLAEVSSMGDFITSSVVESFSIYHTQSAMSYCIMFSELVFLLFSLIHLCFQMFTMIRKGILSYWQDSWNWLEMCLIGTSLSYFAHSIFHFILVVDVIDQFHKGFFQEFVDFNLLLSWHQRNRCLQGILLFLLLIKCLRLLGIYKAIVPSLTMMRLSFSNIIWPMLAGVLFTAAYSYLGRILFSTHAFPVRSFGDSFQMLLLYFLGTNEKGTFFSLYKSNQYATVYYYGTLFMAVIILWSGILRGVLISFMQNAKRSFRSQRLVRFKDVADRTGEKLLCFLGIKRPVVALERTVENSSFYLDEFENLLDELLLRINGLYYSLHCSSLEKPASDQEEVE